MKIWLIETCANMWQEELRIFPKAVRGLMKYDLTNRNFLYDKEFLGCELEICLDLLFSISSLLKPASWPGALSWSAGLYRHLRHHRDCWSCCCGSFHTAPEEPQHSPCCPFPAQGAIPSQQGRCRPGMATPQACSSSALPWQSCVSTDVPALELRRPGGTTRPWRPHDRLRRPDGLWGRLDRALQPLHVPRRWGFLSLPPLLPCQGWVRERAASVGQCCL